MVSAGKRTVLWWRRRGPRLFREQLPSRRAIAWGLGLVFGLWVPGSGEAAVASYSADDTIDTWQVEDGLPQISVTSTAQTPDGYLWLGTFKGVAVVDVNRLLFNPLPPPVVIEEVALDDQVDVSQNAEASCRRCSTM